MTTSSLRLSCCLPAFLPAKQLSYPSNCFPTSPWLPSSFPTRLPLPTRLLAFLPVKQFPYVFAAYLLASYPPNCFSTRQTAFLLAKQLSYPPSSFLTRQTALLPGFLPAKLLFYHLPYVTTSSLRVSSCPPPFLPVSSRFSCLAVALVAFQLPYVTTSSLPVCRRLPPSLHDHQFPTSLAAAF